METLGSVCFRFDSLSCACFCCYHLYLVVVAVHFHHHDHLALLHLSVALLRCRRLLLWISLDFRAGIQSNEWSFVPNCMRAYGLFCHFFFMCVIKKKLEYGHARINSPHTHKPIVFALHIVRLLGHAFYFASSRFVSFCFVLLCFLLFRFDCQSFLFNILPFWLRQAQTLAKRQIKGARYDSLRPAWYWMLFTTDNAAQSHNCSCSRNSFIISDSFWNVNAYGGGDAQIIEGKQKIILIAEVIAWNVFEKYWQNRRMSLVSRVQGIVYKMCTRFVFQQLLCSLFSHCQFLSLSTFLAPSIHRT